MAKIEKEEKNIQAVEEALSKTERFIEKNQKLLLYIIGGIAVIILGFIGFKKYYLLPREKDAQEQMFMAETYFNKDSLDLALSGDGNYFGFEDIVDEYGMTKSKNLAKYYIGITCLKKGEFDKAIENLKSFKSKDMIISSMAKGAIGDAYVELGEFENALSYYNKAAKNTTNIFTTPLFLKKAALVYEKKEDFEKAKEQYEKIKKEYPRSSEAQEIEKYIARVQKNIEK